MAKIIRVDDLTENVDAIVVDDADLWRQIQRSDTGSALRKNKISGRPFAYDDGQYVVTGESSIPDGNNGRYDIAYAYRIVPRDNFQGEVYGEYEAMDFPEGFYHRRFAYLDGQMHVLLGPELAFVQVHKSKKSPNNTQLIIPLVIAQAIEAGAVVAASISGGKDSQALINQLAAYWRDNELSNLLFALHMDLGRAEWNETPAHVEKLANDNGLPLVVVRRPQGDLVQEIEERMEKLAGTDKPFWPSSAARYCTADQKRSQADRVYRDVETAVKTTPFWPSSTNRYCTSHHKSNQADKAYRQYALIISAEGNRAEESPKRSKDPVVSVRKQITAKPLQNLPIGEALATWLAVNQLIDAGDETAVKKQYPDFTRYNAENRPRLAITWYAIHDWTLGDVWHACGATAADLDLRRAKYQRALELEDSGGLTAEVERIKRLALEGWPAHPAYVYGNERLSCALCILATDNDLRNGARHQPELAAHYIHLEEVGGATFKNGRSLAEIINGGKTE